MPQMLSGFLSPNSLLAAAMCYQLHFVAPNFWGPCSIKQNEPADVRRCFRVPNYRIIRYHRKDATNDMSDRITTYSV